MISEMKLSDVSTAAELALKLWPEGTIELFIEEMNDLLSDSEAVVYLKYADENVVGFAHCQLRNDYVEGTDSSPVGYLEGIYVSEPFRKQGIAGELIRACEGFAARNGCTEFASDCEIDNDDSAKMHLKLGFTEAGRIIHFKKTL
ncbi:aminoglycoside 6'-N-acetyltransferase [Corticicoccus populi]|uniref:Aminoglycoside N(6')-acetyltransferase type 1 n=1 Tax=Corticicoccus populi TaxID=1812821 RepID=A0ABW5WQU5_9STAP